jgi:cellobiose-specific phosphotransferase system component IIC
MRTKKLLIAGLAVAMVLVTSTAALAQGEEKTLGDVIKDGGLIGFVIIGMSVAALALVIEHVITIRRDKLVPPELIDELEALFERRSTRRRSSSASPSRTS